MDNEKIVNIQLRNFKNELDNIEVQMKELRKRQKELKQQISLLEDQAKQIKKLDHQTFLNTNFPWSQKAQNFLESIFNLKTFRSLQLSAINATLSGYDVLLIMPTGGGKSLVFQLASLVEDKGLTLVVSPLISLMEDQLNSMQNLGIAAALLNSNTSLEKSREILSSIGDKNALLLLYITPEKLAKSKRLMTQLEKCYKNGNFSRLVIDEVHCCSQWGHDFRTDYKFLGIMRNQFPKVPILGLTATATMVVINDIQTMLNIKGCYVFKDSFFRSNLIYKVEKVDDLSKEELFKKLAQTIKTNYSNQSGLIYCLTVKDVEEVTEKLCVLNIRAKSYHAHLSNDQRTNAHSEWFQNKIQVIVATVAFGMGINKLDVRFVIHYSMSKSFENFYQESGRAGRDGLPADCLIYYKFSDISKATTMAYSELNGLKNVYAMLSFCINQTICRKEQIANYFGDEMKQKCEKRCDNCLHIDTRKTEKIDITKDIKTLINIIEYASRQDKRLTFLKLVDIWLGKGEKKLRPEKIEFCHYKRQNAQEIVVYSVINNYLKEEFHFTPYSTISYVNVGIAWLTRQKDCEILFDLYCEEANKRKFSIKKNLIVENSIKKKKFYNAKKENNDIITIE